MTEEVSGKDNGKEPKQGWTQEAERLYELGEINAATADMMSGIKPDESTQDTPARAWTGQAERLYELGEINAATADRMSGVEPSAEDRPQDLPPPETPDAHGLKAA